MTVAGAPCNDLLPLQPSAAVIGRGDGIVVSIDDRDHPAPRDHSRSGALDTLVDGEHHRGGGQHVHTLTALDAPAPLAEACSPLQHVSALFCAQLGGSDV